MMFSQITTAQTIYYKNIKKLNEEQQQTSLDQEQTKFTQQINHQLGQQINLQMFNREQIYFLTVKLHVQTAEKSHLYFDLSQLADVIRNQNYKPDDELFKIELKFNFFYLQEENTVPEDTSILDNLNIEKKLPRKLSQQQLLPSSQA